MLLKDKNVIITGTNRGIGKAMLEEFAKNGANIWAHTRKETPEFLELISKISKDYNIEIRPVYFDLTDYDAMKNAVKLIMNSKIPVDALVNNAGIIYNALFQMSTEEKLRQQFEVNFFSTFIFTQYISKLMVRQKSGSIINISSTTAMDGNTGKSVYGATKAAIIAMTKSIAAELGEYGIRANCLAPGMIDTEMLNVMPQKVLSDTKDATILKRVGKPSEVATSAVYLASDLSSYITGQVIRIDGGLK